LAQTLAPRAAAAGAVNTLKFGPEGIFGDNTDGVGLVRDLEQNLATALTGQRILLLGAGGAARGVILPLLQHAPSELVIVNRSAGRATELAATFSDAARAVSCVLIGGASEVARGRFDVVINATASSLDHQLPSFEVTALGEGTLAYDMMYAAQPTVFMRHAAQHGARVSDGLGMLVEQAAEAFYVWRGIRPDSATVLAELRLRLRN
jgi:shikimate dehydrogenase